MAMCQLVVDEVFSTISYDRVMIYKFHEDAHGEVCAPFCPLSTQCPVGQVPLCASRSVTPLCLVVCAGHHCEVNVAFCLTLSCLSRLSRLLKRLSLVSCVVNPHPAA